MDRYFTNNEPYSRNVWAHKAFSYEPQVTGLYDIGGSNAVELYHNYWEEAGLPSNGEFGTDFWGAATMYPLKRYYFEPITYSVRTTNPETITLFSWERGSYGHEHDLRRFARAFRALPLVEPRDFDGHGYFWAIFTAELTRF